MIKVILALSIILLSGCAHNQGRAFASAMSAMGQSMSNTKVRGNNTNCIVNKFGYSYYSANCY